MRVLMVSDCYAPRVGGIETQVGDLTAQVLARGVDVEVLTMTPGPPLPHVHRLGRPIMRDLLWDPRTRADLRRLIRPSGNTVVHAHLGVLSPFAADAVRIAVAAGVPVVATWHSRLRPVVRPWAASGVLRRWAAAGVALTAVSSVAAREVSAAAGGARVSVLPNGIDVGTFHPPPVGVAGGAPSAVALDRSSLAAADQPTHEAPLRVVTTMRLAPIKRPLATLAIVARARALAAGSGDIRLQIIGDGRLRPRVEREVERRGLSGAVTLSGRVAREQVAADVAASDVFLSAARLEAFGIAALEARALGVPIVTPPESGVCDIITDGVDGVVAPDDAAMAAALADLATHPDRLAALAAGARATPPHQTWARVTDLVLQHYSTALTGRRDTMPA